MVAEASANSEQVYMVLYWYDTGACTTKLSTGRGEVLQGALEIINQTKGGRPRYSSSLG